jgi:pimeloyl-ACP methyl ester carboxylesterase
MMIKILLVALAGYLAIVAVVFFLQRKMLYLPNVTHLPADIAAEAGLEYWPAPDRWQGFLWREEPAEAQGTVIVFHGNAGAAYDRSFYGEALAAQDMRVILAEYPGYGGRSGSPSEEALVTAALETIRLAHQKFGEPLFLWGESLGCGVVARAVSLTDIPIKGVVLFLPWDSLPNLAQTHYRFLPARWLVRDRYDNIENLKGYEGNVAVVLAGQDEVVPPRHGQRLYDSLTGPKALWRFDSASHNEMPIGPGLPWWKEVIEFISR